MGGLYRLSIGFTWSVEISSRNRFRSVTQFPTVPNHQNLIHVHVLALQITYIGPIRDKYPILMLLASSLRNIQRSYCSVVGKMSSNTSHLNKKIKTNNMGYSDGYIKTIQDDLVHIHIPPTTNSEPYENDASQSSNSTQSIPSNQNVPETVLQYERQLRKQKAAKRASAPLSPSQLDIIYNDEHIIVVNKPSGVLSVPGINSNPSMLTLLYDHLKDELDEKMLKEHMIIHRLDMDTSGIVIYAKSKECMSLLQNAFRERQVDKVYEALLCGHLDPSMSKVKIDLPLQRDHAFPPFMRIATHKSEEDAKKVVNDLNTNGFKKLIKKNAKPSVTMLEVIEREYISINEVGDKNKIDGEMNKIPVTRVKLEPVTGRTHQLRVHCAALGHPIVGDPAYSLLGEANTNGGLIKDEIEKVIPNTPSIELQMDIENWVKLNDRCMCLHARSLRLEHPVTKKEMLFAKTPDF